jgi:threonine/homoserine/homoserine lactone efflux protein
MPLDQLIALSVFALIASITPGPNNTIATATGANWGFRAALPHVLGVPLGLVSMLLAGAAGMAAVIVGTPWLAQTIKWLGIAYLLWIALKFMLAARAPAAPGAAASGVGGLARPLTTWQSAAFQYANPKAWMIAGATAAAYMHGHDLVQRTALICLVFAAISALSVALWSALGDALRDWLRHGHRLRWFNLAMGLSLAATAAWMAWSS